MATDIIARGMAANGNLRINNLQTQLNQEIDVRTSADEELNQSVLLGRASNFYNRLINNDVSYYSNNHVNELYSENEETIPRIVDASRSSEITDNIESSDVLYNFTGFIKCKKYLIINVHNANERVIVYFYIKTGNTYTLNWDIIKTNTSVGVRNYLGKEASRTIYELPDNCYVKFSKQVGNPTLYTWDGEDCGINCSAGLDYLTTTGDVSSSTQNNRYTTVVPSNTRLIFTDSTLWIFTIMGIKSNGETNIINTEYGLRSFEFSKNNDYQSYMVSLEWKGEGINIYNDLWRHLYIISESCNHEVLVGDATKALNNANIINNLEWTPKNNILLRKIDDTNIYYYSGKTYHGIPYSSKWDTPHFVGWHISPHTFVNAVNDENSVIYKETVQSDEHVSAPFYGSVCSSFITMICGFSAPQTNAGLFYDPDVFIGYDDNAPLGKIWSDGGHCIIPVEKIYGENVNVIRVAESLKPLTTITTRYSNVSKEKNSFSHYDGATYFGDTFYTARHKYQTFKLSTLPYADFDETILTNGSARPYKGDKCVYTSAEETVKINLHGDGINNIILEKPSGNIVNIAVDVNAETIETVDVKSYLDEYGVYKVSTNISDIQESFEYVNAQSITVTITNNNITFDRNDFWYALINVDGHWKLSRSNEIACLESRTNGDYSNWFRDGMSIKNCLAVFYKGTYGAYTVPVTKA